jgi:hypothetical protein
MSSEFDSSQMSETELEVASEVTITRSRKARKITAGPGNTLVSQRMANPKNAMELSYSIANIARITELPGQHHFDTT